MNTHLMVRMHTIDGSITSFSSQSWSYTCSKDKNCGCPKNVYKVFP